MRSAELHLAMCKEYVVVVVCFPFGGEVQSYRLLLLHSFGGWNRSNRTIFRNGGVGVTVCKENINISIKLILFSFFFLVVNKAEHPPPPPL